jgi:flagellar biosynthesis/type III secretory pathway M-ring protein FliF/YscJ
MLLNLNHDQQEALRELVSRAVADLSPEIADTDNFEYRDMLRARRERLKEIADQLEADDHSAPM